MFMIFVTRDVTGVTFYCHHHPTASWPFCLCSEGLGLAQLLYKAANSEFPELANMPANV